MRMNIGRIGKEAKYVPASSMVFVEYYSAGNRPGLFVEDKETGAPHALTSNFPSLPMDDDEVAVKDYSENEGVLAALREAGLVEAPHRWIPSGYVMFPVVRVRALVAVPDPEAPECSICNDTGSYWEDVAGDGGSRMQVLCECQPIDDE